MEIQASWGKRVQTARNVLLRLIPSRIQTLRREGDSAENDSAFAARLGVPRSTLLGWLQKGRPRKRHPPDLDAFKAFCDANDCSLDWLAGRDVSRRVSDRTEFGELASALVGAVISLFDKENRSPRGFALRSAFAEVMGGKAEAVVSEHVGSASRYFRPNVPSHWREFDMGQSVILHIDPQAFLRSVYAELLSRATQEHKRARFEDMDRVRKQFSDATKKLFPVVDKVAKIVDENPKSVRDWLLWEAVDLPLSFAHSKTANYLKAAKRHGLL